MFRELLVRKFAPFGSLSIRQVDLLEAHYNLLTQWNRKLNLTRIDSLEESVELHYCESLYVGSKLPSGSLRIVDIGSGAGFPGIPIAILRPECNVTLVESHQRKGVFLREAIRNLDNVNVVTERAENLQAKYDWVVSRAVSPSEVIKCNLANNLALLVGREEIGGVGERIPIPWGEGRYLAFHVKHP